MCAKNNNLEVSRIITANKGRLTGQFKTSLTDEQIKKVDRSLILRKQLEVGNGFKLLDSNTKKEPGVSDYKEVRLDDDQAFIIQRIRIGYDFASEQNKEGFLNYKKNLPNYLRNASIRISQGDKKLSELAIVELANEYRSQTVKGEFFELQEPILLVGGSDLSYEIIYPRGAKHDGKDIPYIELIFGGIELFRAA